MTQCTVIEWVVKDCGASRDPYIPYSLTGMLPSMSGPAMNS
jgi:hypothetical protein